MCAEPLNLLAFFPNDNEYFNKGFYDADDEYISKVLYNEVLSNNDELQIKLVFENTEQLVKMPAAAKRLSSAFWQPYEETQPFPWLKDDTRNAWQKLANRAFLKIEPWISRRNEAVRIDRLLYKKANGYLYCDRWCSFHYTSYPPLVLVPTPSIYTKDNDFWWQREMYRPQFETFAKAKAHFLVFSQSAADSLRASFSEIDFTTSIVPLFISNEWFKEIPSTSPDKEEYFLLPLKGHRYSELKRLLQSLVFFHATSQRKSPKLVVLTEDPQTDDEHIRKMAIDHPRAGQVEVRRECDTDKRRAWFCGAKAVIMPINADGTATLAAQVMAAGGRLIVEDGFTASQVAGEDAIIASATPTGLNEAIEKVLSEPISQERRKEICLNAQHKFSGINFNKKLTELLRENGK